MDAVSTQRSWISWVVLPLALLTLPAAASEFSVSPIRLDLGGVARSGAVVVRNDDTKALSFQIRGADWNQDMQGADVYSDRTDLVYFPKLLVIPAGSEAVIRVGLRQPLVQKEKAYRLFIEEMPAPDTDGAVAGGRVRVLMRFGVPIFVVPAKPQDQMDVDQLELEKGVARLDLTNSGNQHQAIEKLLFVGFAKDGGIIFSRQLADRYVLAGTRKTYTVNIPPEHCANLTRLSVELKTNRSEALRQLDVRSSKCQ